MKTNKLLFIMAILAITPTIAKSQFFAELNAGYAAPMYFMGDHERHEVMFRDELIYNNDTTYITNEYNMGNGIFMSGSFGYKSKGLFIFSIKAYYLNNHLLPLAYNSFQNVVKGEYEYTYNYYGSKTVTNIYDIVYSYYGERISFTPNIGMYYDISSLSVQLNLGFTISSLKIYQISDKMLKTFYEPENEEGISQKYWRQVLKECYKKDIKISPYISTQVNYSISPSISLFSSISWNPFIHFYADYGWQYYYEEKLVEDGDLFYNNVDKNVKDIDETNQKYYNLSSLDLSIGLRYYFGSTKNNGNDE
ncbi:MAG: hypothetical protein ACP5DZ_08895 [Bacteroidales bacterium]